MDITEAYEKINQLQDELDDVKASSIASITDVERDLIAKMNDDWKKFIGQKVDLTRVDRNVRPIEQEPCYFDGFEFNYGFLRLRAYKLKKDGSKSKFELHDTAITSETQFSMKLM